MDEIGIEDARRQLGEIVDRARIADQPTLITRQGKPAAVVVAASWYDIVIDYIHATTFTKQAAGFYAWLKEAETRYRKAAETTTETGDPRWKA